MSLSLPPDLYLNDPQVLEKELVHALQEGYLSLFIGAGVGMSTTPPPQGNQPRGPDIFPGWSDLVLSCSNAVSLSFDTAREKENEYLLEQAEAVEEECRAKNLNFLAIVESALYSRCPAYDKSFLKLDLLVALGSLVMTSTRGSASTIVNYNFDDLLEWYLMLHGYTVTVVSDLPTITAKADVVIYHPHGFLPKTPKLAQLRSRSLIFGKRSYQRAYKESPWNEFQRFRFGCNLCLFIGMSGADQHIEWLFSTVHDQLGGSRIFGAIVLPDTAKSRATEAANKRRGLINYYIKDHDALPDFLLGLCRQAAGI